MQNALLSLGGSYRGTSWEAAARLGLHAWHVSFWEKATKDVSLVAELDGNLVLVRVQCMQQTADLVFFCLKLLFTEQPTVHSFDTVLRLVISLAPPCFLLFLLCLQGESCAAIGYKLELGGMTMRGRVDSHGTVTAGVERRLDPLPATLMLSGHLNHWTDDSRFGIALVVG